MLWRKRTTVWFIAGLCAAGLLQFTQALTLGGDPTALLAIGSADPVSQVVAEELGGAIIQQGYGHDGQVYYAMALDPWGEKLGDLIAEPGYRYRRLLYPATAGLLGHLDGRTLLWSMIVLNAISLGVATAAVSIIADRRSLPWWSPFVILANPGAWLGVELLTPDVMALAFALMAVAAYLSRRILLASMFLAAAILTKEPYATFAIGLVLFTLFIERKRHRAVRIGVVSMTPALAWWSIVRLRLPGSTFQGGNVDLPGRGLVEAASTWLATPTRDQVFTVMSLCFVIGGIWIVVHHRRLIWSWLLFPSLCVAMLSSHFIWDFGNNSVRVLAPLIAVVAIAVIEIRTPTANRQTALMAEAAP
ncbi:MAG: hypothetical protein WB239_17515 [Acidimicrobiia bacterium]